MFRFSTRTLAGAAVCAAASAFAVSCAPADGPVPVAIGIDAHSTEQIVLGEIYKEILQAMGFAVAVTDVGTDVGARVGTDVGEAVSKDPVELLRTEEFDLTVGCTGPLLRERDRATAQRIAEDARDKAGKQAADLSVVTYDAMVATFPSEVRTVDPSPAQGCGAQEEELPSNIVPIFVDGKFDRWATYRINFITRVMATEDIAEMAQRVEEGEAVDSATREWLMEYAGITGDGDLIAGTEQQSAPKA